MFGTLSFPNKGPSKNFKVLSFSHGGSGHSTRKFACEACRVHKVRDMLQCNSFPQDKSIGS
jgi:hypothetical protein